MATRRGYQGRPSFVFLGEERENPVTSDDGSFEFDEADLWSNPNEVVPTEAKNPIPKSGSSKRLAKKGGGDRRQLGAAASLPVSIPDWSKILPDEYKKSVRRSDDDDDGDDDDGQDDDRVPPHEYLARTRTASLSVHEGVGRTLKGRDLSKVRNAIWKQIGFED